MKEIGLIEESCVCEHHSCISYSGALLSLIRIHNSNVIFRVQYVFVLRSYE